MIRSSSRFSNVVNNVARSCNEAGFGSRLFGSKDNNDDGLKEQQQNRPTPGETTYVHPLSRIVLEHLQSNQSTFLIETGLDKGLTINRNGTFALYFPKLNEGKYEDNDCRIWTSYESEEKKHWLNVKKGNLVGRYILQDNLKPAWHSSKLSTPEKVVQAVDQMILKIKQSEQ